MSTRAEGFGGALRAVLSVAVSGGAQRFHGGGVENRGANQQEVVEQRAEADGARLVVNLAVDDIGRRGPLSQTLEGAYGLRRRTG